MSKGSWLRIHKKQLIIHSLIVVAFLLFLFFLAELLLDRFERISGESNLYETELPAATNNIQYWVGQFQFNKGALEIKGWAFIQGQDSLNNEKYIVLKSADRTYVFTTKTMIKRDVTQLFGDQGLNLDYSGFRALIPLRKVVSGEYTVGIYIKKDDIEALQYTNEVADF